MKVFESAGQIHAEINFLKSQGKKIGLVPTMGALHQGHLALIQRALMACDTVACSIFVNPLQFNNPEDYKKYPSTMLNDTKLLEEIDCHLLFHPNYEQVYGQSKPKEYDLGNLNDVMEGAFRPGHFQGVANVVLRFFDIVQPDMAFFGLKDYQQYMVIKRVTAQLMPHIQIVGVETIRDENGLAMSSRNLRLSPDEYASAIRVPALLKEAGTRLAHSGVAEVKEWFTGQVNQIPHLKNEYIEVAETNTLTPVKDVDGSTPLRIFTAFYAGESRLIDNMPV
jgi:pantoate--beta-alanine ligase